MKKTLTIYLILLGCSTTLFASLELFETFVKKEIKSKRPPSASFAILKGDKVVYTKSMGFNDRKMTQTTRTNSVYHVYSLTKILTATLVMQLIEEKKLALNDPIKKFFPHFNLHYKGKEVTITIENLLNHSSGLKDGMKNIPEMIEGEENLHIDLPYFPGTEAKYSSAEYIILSQIVEEVTMESFSDLVREKILKPLKMTRSDFSYNEQIKKTQVYGTLQMFSLVDTVMKFMVKEKSKDTYEGTMLWLKEFDIAWKAAGGLVSSIDDMAKFLAAFNGNKLFSKETKKLFFDKPNIPVNSWMTSQDETSFGIGWYHIQDKEKFFYQHQGVGPGFRTIMRIYPKEDVSIIILTSQTGVDIDAWADKLIESVLYCNPILDNITE
jgi:CubicO group peptidase (beta-lactamase class C family)